MAKKEPLYPHVPQRQINKIKSKLSYLPPTFFKNGKEYTVVYSSETGINPGEKSRIKKLYGDAYEYETIYHEAAGRWLIGTLLISSGHRYDTPKHRENLQKMKEDINKDIKSGQIPATVKSFSELHDYVDANEYLNIPFPNWKHQDINESNVYFDELDQWIKKGRP